MRAYMSGANEWGTANDYMRHCATERAFPALRQNASATEAWAECKGRMALTEARAILAVTEPETLNTSFGQWWADDSPAERSALAEALAAFVGES